MFSFLFISLVTSANAWIHESGACRNLFLLHTLVGRPFGLILRAEPSSNGSSDRPSDSPSELSSHQIPRRLRVPTTAKGLYGKFYFEFTHYAFGGVCANECSLHFGTPLRLRGRAGVFRRREGYLLASPSRTPPSSCSSCLGFLLYEAPPHAEVRRLRIHAPVGLLSLQRLLRHPSCARLCARCTCTGADGCVFPSATAWVFMHRIAYVIALDRLFRGVVLHPGDRTCFPGRD